MLLLGVCAQLVCFLLFSSLTESVGMTRTNMNGFRSLLSKTDITLVAVLHRIKQYAPSRALLVESPKEARELYMHMRQLPGSKTVLVVIIVARMSVIVNQRIAQIQIETVGHPKP